MKENDDGPTLNFAAGLVLTLVFACGALAGLAAGWLV